ncbi:Uncharacterised protein [Bordetella ansorpii]|uniref:Uncharacterized protein n=1 Tax=Bordetella ansorpii TaxID=288768 RepID=A0A157SR56_9BORD|nr:hypothetical protein [Bordetella ansorpii]SAI72940.1 Uncharacterised protein [Bordetella ansorpii]
MPTDIVKYTADELTDDRLDELILNKKDFEVVAVTDMGKVVTKVEGRIERAGLRCRTYTQYRSSVLATGLLGPTVFFGLAAGAAIGIHRLITWSPDYEIGKNRVMRTLAVTYKKKTQS